VEKTELELSPEELFELKDKLGNIDHINVEECYYKVTLYYAVGILYYAVGIQRLEYAKSYAEVGELYPLFKGCTRIGKRRLLSKSTLILSRWMMT